MTAFVNFASGTITDAPLIVGATSIHSAAFATVLPVVTGLTDSLYLTLDPDGVDGLPEIVHVTAHTAASTTVTATRGQQTSIGGTAAREHAVDTAWTLGITALDANRIAGDPGDMKAGIWTSAPTGWLLMGQTVTTASTLYPALWAVVPAAWKSGTSLILPSVNGRVLMGGGTLGTIGGANSHAISEANLPAHTHDIDHNHASEVTGLQSDSHTHAIDHNHASATTSGADQGHVHDIDHNHALDETSNQTLGHSHSIDVVANSTPGTTNNLMRGSATGTVSTLSTDNETAFHQHEVDLPTTVGLVSGSHNQNHTHTVDLPVTSGLESGGNLGSHNHTVDINPFTGVSSSVGSGTNFDHTTSHLRINIAIKY